MAPAERMPPAVAGPRGWVGIQADRVRRLTLDLLALASGLGRVVRYAVAPPPDRPGIAVLAGDDLARVGVPAAYRVRLHNPTALEVTLALEVHGQVDGAAPAFALQAAVRLGPDAVDERWLVCRWPDDAVLQVDAPSIEPIWLADGAPRAWSVEATLRDAGGSVLDRLRIGGRLLA